MLRLRPRVPHGQWGVGSILTCIALWTAVGCGVTEPVDPALVGTYTLIAVNDQQLPWHEGCAGTVTKGALTLNADRTYLRSDPREDAVCRISRTESGFYNVRGSLITFTVDVQGLGSAEVGYATVSAGNAAFELAYEDGLGRRGPPEPVSNVFHYRR